MGIAGRLQSMWLWGCRSSAEGQPGSREGGGTEEVEVGQEGTQVGVRVAGGLGATEAGAGK